MKKTVRGFTLIELLLVVAIIAVLAVAVFVALNPAKRLTESKDARRTTDVDNILTAIHQSIVDSKGDLPTNFPAANIEVQLGTALSGCAIATGGCAVLVAQDACVDVDLDKYLKTFPVDPDNTDPTKTGYSVVRDDNGIITVKACGSEVTNISASR